MPKLICEVCSKEFQRPPSRVNARFCSKSCQRSWNRSDEAIRIRSEGYKRWIKNHPMTGSNNPNFGRRFPEQQKVTDEQVKDAWLRYSKLERPLHLIAKNLNVSYVSLRKRFLRVGISKEKLAEIGEASLKKFLTLSNRKRMGKAYLYDRRMAQELLESWRKSHLTLDEFSKKHGLSHTTMYKIFQTHVPEDYSAIVEKKQGRNYQIGRRFEWRVRDYFKGQGYFVLRSPISRGPVDLVALKKGESLLIQCKVKSQLKGFGELISLANTIDAKAILAYRGSQSERFRIGLKVLN